MPGKKQYPKRSGKVAPAVKSYVKKQMRSNTELKRNELSDQEKIEGTTTDPVYGLDLCNISQGVEGNRRIGTDIRLQGVQVKGMWNNNSGVVNYVRTVIGYLTSPTAATFSASTKLFRGSLGQEYNTSEIYGIGSTPYALMTTPFHPELFHVLFDKVIKIGPSTSTDGNNSRLFNKFIKLHNKKVVFPNSNLAPPLSDLAVPRLVVLRLYTDAGQDAGATLQPIEYSGRTTVWYRDA